MKKAVALPVIMLLLLSSTAVAYSDYSSELALLPIRPVKVESEAQHS